MATANEKRTKARLEQIKEEASQVVMDLRDPTYEGRVDPEEWVITAANLAEEAAGLGLDLLGKEG